jgi:hypothetical protein
VDVSSELIAMLGNLSKESIKVFSEKLEGINEIHAHVRKEVMNPRINVS